MSSAGEFFLWLGVVFPLVFSAGPGNVLCAICGASNGFKNSVPFILGLDVVYLTYSLMLGAGLGLLLTASPALFWGLQLLGVGYIFWLGVQFLRAQKEGGAARAARLTFKDGVISQALNIKGLTIITAMYSQFLSADNSLLAEVLSLSAALLLLNLFTHFTWAYGGAWMASKMTSPAALRFQNKLYAAMLFAVALWLLYRML